MKVGSLILSYGTTDFLEPCIKQYQWLDDIQVMNFLFTESKPFPDDTQKICSKLGVHCDSGYGLKQHEVLNNGLNALRKCDYVFVADNDEFITRADQEKLIKLISQGHGNVSCRLYDYIDNIYTKYEDREHHPIVIATPETRFYEVRNAWGGYKTDDVVMHHMGFMFSDTKMQWKRDKQKITNGGQLDELMKRKKVSTAPPEEIVKCLSAVL